MWSAAYLVAALALAQMEPTLGDPPSGSPPASMAMPVGSGVPSAQPSEQSFGTSTAAFMAQEPPLNELPPVDESMVELPSLQMSVTVLPSFDSSGFGITSFDVHHTWLMGYGEVPPLNVTPGLGMHLWSGPTALDLPPRVYDMYLDLNWRPLDFERGGISMSFIPGLYGDFEHVDEHTFQLAGWLLGDYRLTDGVSVLAGIAYYRQLESNWLPVGGMIWTPNEDTRVELLFPQPKVAWRFYSDGVRSHWGYVAGQFGGGAWSVADTATTNVLVSYSDLRLLFGWEGGSIHGREWRVELGYVFSRDIGVNNVSVYSPGDTIVAQAMFAF